CNISEEDKSTQTKQHKSMVATSEATAQCSTNSVLGKYESRSLEYLTSNYCKFCHKSHRPCCPNSFQHPNTVKLEQYTRRVDSTRPGGESEGKIKSSDVSSDTLTE